MLSSSDTNYLELAQIPRIKGSVPHKIASLQTPIAIRGPPHVPHFCLTWLQTGVPKTSLSSGSIIFYMAHRTQGNNLLTISS